MTQIIDDNIIYINNYGNTIYKKYFFYENSSNLRSFNYLK